MREDDGEHGKRKDRDQGDGRQIAREIGIDGLQAVGQGGDNAPGRLVGQADRPQLDNMGNEPSTQSRA